jgi:high affinity Mn2+ porin
MRGLLVAGVWLLVLGVGAHAADLGEAMAVKAPPASAAADWTGFYVGAHLGYAVGSSNWSATSTAAAGPALAGSLDLYNAYGLFTGTGSYLAGLQAGYNYLLPARIVLGIEADASFPNTIAGTATLAAAPIGVASYADEVEFSGTVRGRLGYAPGPWLFYATGGFAFSYDQFTRTQPAGMPAGGTALPGAAETLFMVPRVGGAAGLGAELALTPHWAARLEYLFTDYASRGVSFPAGAQRFDSDLALQTLRVGLDYQLGHDGIDPAIFTAGPSALDLDRFIVHGQGTFIEQYAAPFRDPYSGTNSLAPNSGRETADIMLAGGFKLWRGAELWIDPELGQGFGLSNTEGIAGFPSGAAFRVGASVPYPRIQRTFIRQTIDLGGDSQKVDADFNQFAGSRTADRLVITIGKYSVSDIFDNNKYAQDARKDFMNWALIDAGTFDYAADAWGYTYGAALEWYRGTWTLRSGLFDLSNVPNSTDLDPTFQQFQWLGEIERRYDLWGHPGKVAVTGFLSRGRMGSFEDAIALAAITGGPADIAAVRKYQSRGGVSANLEQEITSDLGVFMRAGWADGDIEPFDYTDVDRTVAGGVSLNGKQWGRANDTVGVAGIVNGISGIHEAFLNDGGLGILVGDGKLPNPGLEQIIEAYYSYALTSATKVTFDYQFVVNPAYNTDRGPVNIVAGRFHTQF